MVNINLMRGDSHCYLVELRNPDILNEVNRVDLQAVNQARNRVLSLSTTDGTIERVNEGLLLNFPPSATCGAHWRRVLFDLQLSFDDGRVKTILNGSITLQHDITTINEGNTWL